MNHVESHASDLDTPAGRETSLKFAASIPVSEYTNLCDAFDGGNNIDAK